MIAKAGCTSRPSVAHHPFMGRCDALAIAFPSVMVSPGCAYTPCHRQLVSWLCGQVACHAWLLTCGGCSGRHREVPCWSSKAILWQEAVHWARQWGCLEHVRAVGMNMVMVMVM